MKFAHLADLHFGITVNGVSMIEEQRYIITEILKAIAQEDVDVVLVAGDVYDRYIPSIEAMQLFEHFLFELVQLDKEVIVIAGNHDSGDRLAFGSSLFKHAKIHILGNYEGKLEPIVLHDAYGEIFVYGLPYVRPSHINRFLDDTDKVEGYTNAIAKAIELSNIDFTKRNILLSHQFVSGSKVNDNGKEIVIVGGVDNIEPWVYKDFDFVALGHLHTHQSVGFDHLVYCGTPLSYNFGDAHKDKSLHIVELKEKGQLDMRTLPLQPRHALRTIVGSYQDIIHHAQNDTAREDYMRFILTDKQTVLDAMHHLRMLYPNALALQYQSLTTMVEQAPIQPQKHQDPLAIFARFYNQQTGEEMSEAMKDIMQEVIAEVFARKEAE